jgi:hypothetical protein
VILEGMKLVALWIWQEFSDLDLEFDLAILCGVSAMMTMHNLLLLFSCNLLA